MPKPEKVDKALSDAARAVVRDPGDPRIDAHLAALGLGPDAPAPSQPQSSPRAADEAERRLAEVSAQLADAAPEHICRELVLAGVPVAGLGVTRPSLEELFVGLTGEGFDVEG